MPPLQFSMDANTSYNLLTPRSLPLENVKEWSQNVNFEIDALGLVTLLGADEVNLSVGTLQRRRYTEYLPLLAAFVVSGNRFTIEQPGFVLYNLSDGITSTELKGWFTRWLMSQKINNATTVFEWKSAQKKGRRVSFIAPALSVSLVTPLLVCTALMGDWYGVGNSIAIIVSIFTRIYLLAQLRRARNFQIQELRSSRPQEPVNSSDSATEKPREQPAAEDIKTLCVIRSDGKMVTIKVPAEVLGTFIKDSTVQNRHLYTWARRVGWLALGAHMCILGMCTLFTQIYTVVLLVLSTWALSTNFPRDLQHEVVSTHGKGDFAEKTVRIPFNKDWDVVKTDYAKFKPDPNNKEKRIDCDRRQYAWARLKADDPPFVRMMTRWNLFPENEQWWKSYDAVKAEIHPSSGAAEQHSATPLTLPNTSRPHPQSTNSTSPLLSLPTNTSDSRSLTPEVSRSSSPSKLSAQATSPASL